MATINSIRKQLESAKNRAESFRTKIDMYETRLNNAIEKAIKVTGNNNITVDNFNEVLSRDNWELRYKIGNALDYRNENIRNLTRENLNIQNLAEQIGRMEFAAKEKEMANAPLKAALVEAMADFRTVWFERMNNWYSNHYDEIRAKYDDAKEIRNRIDSINRKYFIHYSDIRRHARIYNNMQIRRQNAIEIIVDDANRMDKDEYMVKINEMLVKDWNNGIELLTEKCKGFGVDAKNVKTSNPDMTAKGFSVIITDGTNRVIDARVIWAAEYSDIVTPHTRYIVTERRK